MTSCTRGGIPGSRTRPPDLLIQYFKERHYSNGVVVPVKFTRLVFKKSRRRTGSGKTETPGTAAGGEAGGNSNVYQCLERGEKDKTFPGLLQQLENLGHKRAPVCDGLNVDLLYFQQQSVGWALERENTPGKVQSFLRTKANLTYKQQKNQILYFCPFLDMFSLGPPKRVCG